MKKDELIAAVMAGKPVLCVEFRSTRADVIRWKDKTTGVQKSAPICEHNVELGDVAVTVREDLPQDADVTKVTAPFPKGTRCVLHLNTLERNGSAFQARGKLEPLTER